MRSDRRPAYVGNAIETTNEIKGEKTMTIRALHSRTTRLLASIAAIVGALAISAPAAFANVNPDGPNVGAGPSSTPVIVAHAGDGIAVWTVVLIAIAAIAAGAGLRELVRSFARFSRMHRPAMSQ